MIRRLRTRIIVFVVALLAVVQVVAYVVVSSANSTNAREKIDSELAVGERVFARLLEQNRERLAQAARVMAADYALRGAIASGDQDTVVSALSNHGGRIKADMTLLMSLDRRVVADTIASNERGRLFEFPQLIDRADREGGASSIEVIDGRAYQLVVVPVLAATPMAWIAVGFVIDDNVVSELQQLTSLQVSFLERHDHDRQWGVLASTLGSSAVDLASQLPALPDAALVHSIGAGENEQQLRVITFDRHGDRALVAVLQRSVAAAVAAFNRLQQTLALGARAGHSPVRAVALERHAAASVGEHLGARSAQPRAARLDPAVARSLRNTRVAVVPGNHRERFHGRSGAFTARAGTLA